MVIDNLEFCKNKYFFKIENNFVYIFFRVDTPIEYKLFVSSISPNIGSIRGGTKVYINGEGFRYSKFNFFNKPITNKTFS